MEIFTVSINQFNCSIFINIGGLFQREETDIGGDNCIVVKRRVKLAHLLAFIWSHLQLNDHFIIAEVGGVLMPVSQLNLEISH